jgi:hypothetical protein
VTRLSSLDATVRIGLCPRGGRFWLARDPGTSEASPLREALLANSHLALPVKPIRVVSTVLRSQIVRPVLDSPQGRLTVRSHSLTLCRRFIWCTICVLVLGDAGLLRSMYLVGLGLRKHRNHLSKERANARGAATASSSRDRGALCGSLVLCNNTHADLDLRASTFPYMSTSTKDRPAGSLVLTRTFPWWYRGCEAHCR